MESGSSRGADLLWVGVAISASAFVAAAISAYAFASALYECTTAMLLALNFVRFLLPATMAAGLAANARGTSLKVPVFKGSLVLLAIFVVLSIAEKGLADGLFAIGVVALLAGMAYLVLGVPVVLIIQFPVRRMLTPLSGWKVALLSLVAFAPFGSLANYDFSPSTNYSSTRYYGNCVLLSGVEASAAATS